MSSDLKNSEKLCRLCANAAEDSGSNNLFEKNNRIVIQQIKELTGLTLNDNPRQMLPRYFCIKCKEDLPRACAFQRQIIRTQKYFKSQEYKSKFVTNEKELKPTFTFVQLSEYETKEVLSTKPNQDGSEEASDENLTPADCVETIIKKETKEDNPQNVKEISTNISNNGNNFKKNIRRKSLKHIDVKKAKFREGHDGNQRREGENLNKDNFDCLESFSDNYTSDDSSSTCSDSLKQSDDLDFMGEFINRKSNIELPNNLKNKKDPPDILKNRQFSCHLCKRPLESLICLKIHFQKQHKGEKFKCDKCEEKFSTIKSLVRHFRLHLGEHEFKCHYCDMSFKYSTIRCRHERRMHSKDPPFLCFICGKTFITSTMGRDHLTVHTKERAFHCTVCKADFLRKSHLNTHYRSMTHKNNQQKLAEEISKVNVNNSQQYLDAPSILY